MLEALPAKLGVAAVVVDVADVVVAGVEIPAAMADSTIASAQHTLLAASKTLLLEDWRQSCWLRLQTPMDAGMKLCGIAFPNQDRERLHLSSRIANEMPAKPLLAKTQSALLWHKVEDLHYSLVQRSKAEMELWVELRHFEHAYTRVSSPEGGQPLLLQQVLRCAEPSEQRRTAEAKCELLSVSTLASAFSMETALAVTSCQM